MSTDVQNLEMDIDKIDVVDGFNSREHFDETELERLAKTIESDGVVQPVKVRPTADGRAQLVAGERRFRAAQRAGREKVPITISTGNPRAEAFIENHHRADLNPIETARDVKAFAEEFGLKTQKEIAVRANKTESWVGDHLRLLKLPEEVQRYIAEGTVPMEAERVLRPVAKVSPGVAACICELAKRRNVKPSRFVSVFDDLLAEVPSARFADKPTMIPVGHVRLKEVVTDRHKRDELIGRLSDALEKAGRVPDDDPEIEFGEPEVDAARAAGCLIERKVDQGEWTSYIHLVTDAEFAADLCERRIDRFERDVDERNRKLAAQEADRAERERKYKARQQGVDPDGSLAKQAEERKAKRAEAEQKKKDARLFNEDLGRNIIERRGGASRKKHSLNRFKLVATALLRAYPELAGRGLRLVLPQLKDVQVKTLKSGDKREKITYAEIDQAAEYLARKAASAGSVNEGLEWLADAFLAAVLADEEAVAQSKRTRQYRATPGSWVTDLLADEIKEVRPRRRRKK